MDSTKKLEILLTAKDKASASLKGFSGKLKSLAATAAKAGAALVAAGAVAATAFGKKAVDAAVDLSESINAVEKTFGKASAKIFEFGKVSAEQAGLSKAAFNSAVVPIGAMLQNMGIEAGKAADQSVNLGKRAADLASVFNTDLETALTAIQAGLRGEADPLEKFGVGLKQSAVKAYALEQGLIGAGEEMDETARATAALGLFMEQTSKFAGDFVDTSDQVANRQRIAKARFEDLSATIGEKILPAYEALLGVVEGFINNGMPMLSQWIDNVKGKFEEWKPRLVGVKDQIIEVARQVADFLLPRLNSLWEALNKDLIPALTRLWHEVLEPLIPVIGVVLVGAVGLAVDILARLVSIVSAVINVVVQLIEWFKNAAGVAFNFAKEIGKVVSAFGSFAKKVYSVIQPAVNFVRDQINDLINIFKTISGAIVGALTGVYNAITSPFRAAFSYIRGEVNGVASSIRGLTNSATKALQSASSSAAGLPGKAHGGSVQAGKPYEWQERGREYFVPNQPGQVVKHMDAQRMGSSKSIEINGNIIINVDDARTAGKSLLEALDRDSKLVSMGMTGLAR